SRTQTRKRGRDMEEMNEMDGMERAESTGKAAVRSRGNGAANGGGDNRQKAIAHAVSTIEKQFGKGAILTMTADGIDREIDSFSTGGPSLDLPVGIGGHPRGRVVEINGPEAPGKTTLSLHAVAEIHRQGGIAAFGDAEHALD